MKNTFFKIQATILANPYSYITTSKRTSKKGAYILKLTTVKVKNGNPGSKQTNQYTVPFLVSVLSLALTPFNFISLRPPSFLFIKFKNTSYRVSKAIQLHCHLYIQTHIRIAREKETPPPALPEMTVFGHSSVGGKQVVPFDYETEISQRLLESAHSSDNVSAFDCIADPLVDVNYVGAVWLNVRKAELVCRDESPIEIRFELEKFKTDVTPLFLAVHNGNVALVNKLLVSLFS